MQRPPAGSARGREPRSQFSYNLEGAITRRYYSLAGQVIAIRSQYFDAWGKRLTGSISATDRSYTGQYLDDTGLLFYNARYYDPGIGRFVSADSISPGKDNPQNRNRYSYTINNPLKYIDPTGHCAEAGQEQTLESCYAYVSGHGWLLDLKDWTFDTLLVVAESIRDLKTAAGWDTGDYMNTMSNNGQFSLILKRVGSFFWDSNRPADVAQRGNSITMTVYDALFRDTKDMQRFNLVHEQAHVWDAATGGALSGNMMKATGSGYTWWGEYRANGATSSTYLTTHREDWADTVAAAVYPGKGRSVDASGNPRMGVMRQTYIKKLLPYAVLFNGTYTLNQAQ